MVQGYSASPDQVTCQVLGYWGDAFSLHNSFIFRPKCNMNRIRAKNKGNSFFLSSNEQRNHQRIFLCESFGGSCTCVSQQAHFVIAHCVLVLTAITKPPLLKRHLFRNLTNSTLILSPLRMLLGTWITNFAKQVHNDLRKQCKPCKLHLQMILFLIKPIFGGLQH